MNYLVKIADSALEDMDRIYSYIRYTLKNPDVAAMKYDRIAGEILTLEEYPLRFNIPQFEPCISMALHRMVVDNYSVFYLVRGDIVLVTDVLYSASDLESNLEKRYNL